MAPTNPCSHLLVTVLSLLTIISISTSFPTTQSDDPLLKILHTSLTQLSTTISTATHLHRRINEQKQQAELEDCLQLLDLSRDRVLSSVRAITKSAHTDARTWLSAVLTNYDTCLDGLNGYVKLSMESQLKSLMKSTSVSLALLATSDDDDVITQVVEFPSWISKRDRKLLEARTPKDVQANVVVAKDGSGKFKTVQEALNSVPDNGNTRYVIYVKKGVYKETVRLEKKKKNVMIVGDGMDATVITGSQGRTQYIGSPG